MNRKSSAIHVARATLSGLARSLALLALVPALLFNIDWTGAAGWPYTVAAVAMIIGSALLIDVALRHPHLVRTPLLLLVGLFMVYGNTKTAIRNLSLASELASEARETRMASGAQLASQRSRLEERRKAQAAVAGETALATLEAEVEALKIAEPDRWRKTKGCDPAEVTKSIDFCLRFAQTKAKVAAAVERDKIDQALASLPSAASLKNGVAEGGPKVADAYIANVTSLLGEMGIRPTERLVAAEEALSRALALELLAAFGPFAWLRFLDGAVPAARSRFSSPKKTKDADEAPPEPAKADAVDRWIADTLETHEGAVVTPKAMRSTPGFPASKRDENAVWQRIKRLPGVRHDPNNGRPRYIGLRLKAKGPVLAAVDGTRT